MRLQASAEATTFIPLGDFPAGLFGSGASGISGDGATIVGGGRALDFESVEAAQWTTSGAIAALRNDLSDDGLIRSANATSQNGSVIVGSFGARPTDNPFFRGTNEAFRWTAETGIVPLGFLPGGSVSSTRDVSSNGEVITGTSDNSDGNSRAFRWESETGIVSLGTLPTNFPNSNRSHATAISADGSVIVGTSNSQAFRWTEQSGLVGLGDLPGGFVISGAEDISSDGTTIVGSSSSELSQGSSEAYRWTEETGMQGLGFLNPTDHTSTAEFTSSDGRLVFGFAFGFDSHQFYVWDPLNGMRDLVDVFEGELNIGTHIAGWSEFRATGISDDGLSLVGSGFNPDGNIEAWLIQLDQPIGVPEPSTMALFLGCVSLFSHRYRR